MGLDMYLYLKIYDSVSIHDNNYNEKVKDFYPKDIKELADKNGVTLYFKETSYTIGYWRKANAIHGYFVNVLNNGIDKCEEIYVSLDNLQDLLKIVQQVKADHNLASQLLPTCEGFFFGSVEYDEYYWQDLDKTERILTNTINLITNYRKGKKVSCSVYYQASW